MAEEEDGASQNDNKRKTDSRSTQDESRKRPCLRISELAPELVAINVEDQKTFHVHKDLLTHHSEYFRGAFNGSFKEAGEKKIDLPHVPVDTFKRFIDWLYTKRLILFEPRPSPPRDTNKDEEDKYQKEAHQKTRELCDLYVFADGHDVPDLRRQSIDALFDHLDDIEVPLPDYSTIADMYSRLPELSPLLKLLIDFECRWRGKDLKERHECLNRARSMLPVEFLVTVMNKYAELTELTRDGNLPPDYDLAPCDYHGHVSREDSAACPRN